MLQRSKTTSEAPCHMGGRKESNRGTLSDKSQFQTIHTSITHGTHTLVYRRGFPSHKLLCTKVLIRFRSEENEYLIGVCQIYSVR